MPPSTPFVDRATGSLDTGQILAEVVPLAKLIGLFVALALVPLTLAFLLGGPSIAGVILAAVGQFILTIGAGVVLLYIISRAIQLSDG